MKSQAIELPSLAQSRIIKIRAPEDTATEELHYGASAVIGRADINLKIDTTRSTIATTCEVKAKTLQIPLLHFQISSVCELGDGSFGTSLLYEENDLLKSSVKTWRRREMEEEGNSSLDTRSSSKSLTYDYTVTKNNQTEKKSTVVIGDRESEAKGSAPTRDLLSLLSVLRNHGALEMGQEINVQAFRKTWPIDLGISFVEEKLAVVECLGSDSRLQLRAKVDLREPRLDKNSPQKSEAEKFLERDETQIWIDQQTGIISSIALKVLKFPLIELKLLEFKSKLT